MERVNYIELFSIPDSYKPPDDSELRSNTQYPNLNSRDYRKKPVERTLKIQPFFECLDVNNEGKAILATNDIRGRSWNGSIWGFENIESLGDQEKSCFKLHCDSPVTRIKYAEKRIFIASQANGSLQVWSTQAEVRNSKNYCLFMIGGRSEHIGIILSLDILPVDKTKIVTGSSDCCLKIWDIGAGDLFSIHTMFYGHSDSITDISSSHTLDSTFASCSRDKSALIWDYRLPRPAKALYEDHVFPFSSIYWTKEDECNGHIILGDEAGTIYEIDPKVPNKFLSQTEVFDRPIRKISFNATKMSILGNTNIVKSYNISKDNSFEYIYMDESDENILRDIYWSSDDEFYTIGWDSKLRKHKIN